jgi:hypothetical protein
MKKPIKYKRFLIIFGAILVLIPVVWFSVRAVFPLPPERKMTVIEKETLLLTVSEEEEPYVHSDITPYDEESLLVSVKLGYSDGDDKSDRSIIYIISRGGEILRQFDLPYTMQSVFVFEDGIIGMFRNKDGNNYLEEYSPAGELLSSKINTPKIVPLSGWLFYEDGLFYGTRTGSGEEAVVFTRDFEIIETYTATKENPFFSLFCQGYDGTPYRYEIIVEEPIDDLENISYYIGEKDGELSRIPVSKKASFASPAPRPGDSEYPLYGDLINYGFINQLFWDDIFGRYICGLRPDGSIDTILSLEGGDYFNFYEGVPLGENRYYAKPVNSSAAGQKRVSEVYFYEYTAVYED